MTFLTYLQCPLVSKPCIVDSLALANLCNYLMNREYVALLIVSHGIHLLGSCSHHQITFSLGTLLSYYIASLHLHTLFFLFHIYPCVHISSKRTSETPTRPVSHFYRHGTLGCPLDRMEARRCSGWPQCDYHHNLCNVYFHLVAIFLAQNCKTNIEGRKCPAYIPVDLHDSR